MNNLIKNCKKLNDTMSLKGGDIMNTYINKWLVVCISLCSLSLSYTWQDLMDPTFQPYEDRDITIHERARLIKELKSQDESFPSIELNEKAPALKSKDEKEVSAKEKAFRDMRAKKERDALMVKDFPTIIDIAPELDSNETEADSEALLDTRIYKKNKGPRDQNFNSLFEESDFIINAPTAEDAAYTKAKVDAEKVALENEAKDAAKREQNARKALTSDPSKPEGQSLEVSARPYINPDFLPLTQEQL